MWTCEYCFKTISLKQKDLHCKTNRHKFKARWAKYFSLYDELIKELDEDNKLLNYSLKEYEDREFDIIKELDQLLISGIFDETPDED